MFRSKIKILILQFLSFFIFIGLSIGCENNDPIEPEINDPIVEVPDLTDNEILDFVQKETLKYFWEFAESNSGAARERYHPDKLIELQKQHKTKRLLMKKPQQMQKYLDLRQ